MSEVYLAHHGIKGQKWGVRRYQNKDGSLTEAGKKKLAKNPDRTRKNFQKQVNSQRGKVHGWSNRWMSGTNIGKNSEIVEIKGQKAENDYLNSKGYKSVQKKIAKLDRDVDSGKVSMDDYAKKYDEIWNPSQLKAPPNNSYSITSKGRKYLTNYPDTLGKDLTKAYIKDLGYSEEAAKYIQSVIRKSKYQVLD